MAEKAMGKAAKRSSRILEKSHREWLSKKVLYEKFYTDAIVKIETIMR